MRNYRLILTFIIINFSIIGFAQDLTSLSKSIQDFLYEEQVLHNKDLWYKDAFKSDIDPKYLPENRAVFAIGYYLLPLDKAELILARSLNPKVREQLIVQKMLKKYVKFFVHPESEKYFEFLKEDAEFVSANQSEYLATATSSYRTLAVWNAKDLSQVPFMAKTSLDRDVVGSIHRLVGRDEVVRSLANQEALSFLRPVVYKNGLKYFSETLGVMPKSVRKSPVYMGGMIIREFPEEIIKGTRRWISFSALMSNHNGEKPLAMKLISHYSGGTKQFYQEIMMNSYMRIFNKITSVYGINFEPHSQNLLIETDANYKPTGNLVIRDFGGIWPDKNRLQKFKKIFSFYNPRELDSVYKFTSGATNYLDSYIYFYKPQVYDRLLDQIALADPQLTTQDVAELRTEINNRYLYSLNAQFSLRWSDVPTTKSLAEAKKVFCDLALLPHRNK